MKIITYYKYCVIITKIKNEIYDNIIIYPFIYDCFILHVKFTFFNEKKDYLQISTNSDCFERLIMEK